jgi:hypothetical protein
MAASSCRSQYLNDYFNERTERVNRLQDENKVLHIKLAEKESKNREPQASVKAMKLCLNSLMDTAGTSMRTSDGSGSTEVTTVSLLLAILYSTSTLPSVVSRPGNLSLLSGSAQAKTGR